MGWDNNWKRNRGEMKHRERGDGGGGGGGSEKGTGKSHGWNRWSRQKRNEQRIGGKGLSLVAFANAKSGASGYNPALIKKQREFYKNAKYVKKYKKTLKQQNFTSDHIPSTSYNKDDDQTGNLQVQTKMTKKSSRFLSLREEYEKKHAEDEKARIEREAIIQAKNEQRAKAEAKRKANRERMFKKTKYGQPVMKYRIEHILEGLIGSSQK